MKTVTLLQEELVGTVVYQPGDSVTVPDDRADHMVKAGAASIASDDGKKSGSANADHDEFNPLADVIDPLPLGGPVVNPADAAVPSVQDNPGLARQVETTAGMNATDVETEAGKQAASPRRSARKASQANPADSDPTEVESA